MKPEFCSDGLAGIGVFAVAGGRAGVFAAGLLTIAAGFAGMPGAGLAGGAIAARGAAILAAAGGSIAGAALAAGVSTAGAALFFVASACRLRPESGIATPLPTWKGSLLPGALVSTLGGGGSASERARTRIVVDAVVLAGAVGFFSMVVRAGSESASARMRVLVVALAGVVFGGVVAGACAAIAGAGEVLFDGAASGSHVISTTSGSARDSVRDAGVLTAGGGAGVTGALTLAAGGVGAAFVAGGVTGWAGDGAGATTATGRTGAGAGTGAAAGVPGR
jgi:hypothetical protein